MTSKKTIVLALLTTSLGVWVSGASVALEKEMSLVTKQPIGELAVAGRLSIDLHSEFMVSRTYENNTVLNWYNCGYSGGGPATKVGGAFGDFGFQVPFKEREKKYPHAVTIDKVPAVRFDGGDFLKGNIEVETNIAGTQNMAIEIWLSSDTSTQGQTILGWQSKDGRQTSAPIAIPAIFKPSKAWQHIVVNCTPETEDWYLNGARISSSKRTTIIKAGHIMVLGGASSASPSFRGDLAAVRLHDAAMTEEEITHNFKGGVMLGTEMHSWWRTEPDKWYVVESEHFRHCVDKEEMKGWTERQLKEFTDRVPGMLALAELNYHTYSERLAKRSSVVSVLPEERGDGIKYKTPIQPSNGSWMGWDGHFGWACQGAGFINPHELAHGWDAMTGNIQGNFWEVSANFPQTYNGVYQTIPVIAAESSAFPASGRTYYHDRLMFEHLAQTPEYGPMFISKIWYDGPTADDKGPSPWHIFNRINPYPDRTLSVEFTKMAMKNVTYDYITFAEAPAGQGNTPYGNDGVVSKENRYRKAAQNMQADIRRYARVLLEKVPYEPEWWRVPREQAPQQFGWNICPLQFKPGKVTATLAGYVNPARGSDWRAGFVGVDAEGNPVYSEVFGPKKTQTFNVTPNIKELYLVVCATPTNVMTIDMVGDFRSFEQQQFPYKVKFGGCQPLDVMVTQKPTIACLPHPNGGGFVESTAHVDATAYVGPNAQVLGKSQVLGNARIGDYAVIQNATVKDNAIVGGHALVTDNSVIAENAKIRGYAVVKGRTTVKGNAKVLEHAAIFTQKTCTDNAVIKGVASVYGGNQSGTAMIDGFYAKGNEITKGKWFTWSWGQGKNPGEIDEEFGGMYADYTFEQDHGAIAIDNFGATWGYIVNSPKRQIVPERVERSVPATSPVPTKSGQVLVLDGKTQFVELPRDIADMANCTYTAEFKWNGTPGARVYEFANPNGDALWLTPSENGKLTFAIRRGKSVEKITAPAVKKGAWQTVMVIIDGKNAMLYVNGKKVAENNNMTLAPDSIRATQCYLGRGLKGNYFGGMIGRFTVHSVALMDRTPPTPNPPAFAMKPIFTSPSALTMASNAAFDPLGNVEYYFEEVGGTWNSGWVKDNTLRVEGADSAKPGSYRVKMRDKCGNETAFSAPVKAEGAPADAPVFEVAGETPTVIEAESFARNVAVDGSAWELVTNLEGFVGKGAMQILPDRGANIDPPTPGVARLDYLVNFAKPGRHFVWLRTAVPNPNGDSVHIGLDMKIDQWGNNIGVGGKYAWTGRREFNVPTAGIHTFSIWLREDGVAVDRILFTTLGGYEPGADQRAPDKSPLGEGPAESPSRPVRDAAKQ